MDLVGTDFQIKVWKEIKKIPKGKVKTYKELAKAIASFPFSYNFTCTSCFPALSCLSNSLPDHHHPLQQALYIGLNGCSGEAAPQVPCHQA